MARSIPATVPSTAEQNARISVLGRPTLISSGRACPIASRSRNVSWRVRSMSISGSAGSAGLQRRECNGATAGLELVEGTVVVRHPDRVQTQFGCVVVLHRALHDGDPFAFEPYFCIFLLFSVRRQAITLGPERAPSCVRHTDHPSDESSPDPPVPADLGAMPKSVSPPRRV